MVTNPGLPTNIADTAPIRSGEALDWVALESFLREELGGIFSQTGQTGGLPPEQMNVAQFPGGHSNLTYCLAFGSTELVLRRPPFGPVAPTAHDMPRECRLLQAIHPHFPLAPQALLLVEDPKLLGAPFYVMERRRGLVIRNEIPPEIGENPELRRRISESLVDSLVALHEVEIERSGLITLGKPAGFARRQVEGWSRRWDRARLNEVPEMHQLAEWLTQRLPADPVRPTLVHNDYKLDNVMLDHNDPSRLVAILDWEMATVGDPLIDLGLLLCYWPEADDPEILSGALPCVTTLPGWLKRDDLVERYAARSGRDPGAIAWYHIFALFKLAVVLQQIYYRFRSGQTNDPRFTDFGMRVAALARWAWSLSQSPSG